MNAPTYGVEKITQAREGEYRVQFSRPQLADVVREQKRLRIREPYAMLSVIASRLFWVPKDHHTYSIHTSPDIDNPTHSSGSSGDPLSYSGAVLVACT